jgi:hypothetical protein
LLKHHNDEQTMLARLAQSLLKVFFIAISDIFISTALSLFARPAQTVVEMAGKGSHHSPQPVEDRKALQRD